MSFTKVKEPEECPITKRINWPVSFGGTIHFKTSKHHLIDLECNTDVCVNYRDHTSNGTRDQKLAMVTNDILMLDNRSGVDRRELHEQITDDQNKYLLDGWEQKRMKLSAMINSIIIDELGDLGPDGRVTMAKMDAYCLAAVYVELWGWVNKVIIKEHFKYNCYLPVSLMTAFERVYDMIKKCLKTGDVTMANSLRVMRLRDKVLKCVQHLYRVFIPLQDGTEIYLPVDLSSCQYNPHDYEWIASNTYANVNKTPVPWVSAANQSLIDIERFRLAYSTETAISPTIFCNMQSYDPAQSSWDKFKDMKIHANWAIDKLTQIYKMQPTPPPILAEAYVKHKFRFLQEELDMLAKVLLYTTIETQMLLLHAAFVNYADYNEGFVGGAPPLDFVFLVHSLENKWFSQISECFQLNSPIVRDLEKIRDCTAEAIKEYYQKKEKDIERMVQTPMDKSVQNDMLPAVPAHISYCLPADRIRLLKLEKFQIVKVTEKRRLTEAVLNLRVNYHALTDDDFDERPLRKAKFRKSFFDDVAKARLDEQSTHNVHNAEARCKPSIRKTIKKEFNAILGSTYSYINHPELKLALEWCFVRVFVDNYCLQKFDGNDSTDCALIREIAVAVMTEISKDLKVEKKKVHGYKNILFRALSLNVMPTDPNCTVTATGVPLITMNILISQFMNLLLQVAPISVLNKN
ncbi:unnamed protein product [Caenorhabditis sp. 36 PRJEB53466]|nr:unnamed protein product [Caenorhabditis sp. 36 PRJEB53466]